MPPRLRAHPLAAADRQRARVVATARAQRGRLGVRRRLATWSARRRPAAAGAMALLAEASVERNDGLAEELS